jgi:hypothetical protein
MIYIEKSRNKIESILGLVIEIFDNFMTSYELMSHQTREAKLNRLLEHLYIKHYSELNSRAAVLAIFAHIAKLAEGATSKYLLQHFLDSPFTLNKIIEHEVAYVPSNDRCMVENLLKTNVFRTNILISNNIALLMRNLFTKPNLFDKTLDLIDRLFEEIDEASKKDEEEEGQMGWIVLRKSQLFSELIVNTGVVFKSRLDDRLMRFFKRLVENTRRKT